MAKSFSFIGSVKIAAFLGLTISAHLAASQTEGTPLLRLQHSTAALAIDSAAPHARGLSGITTGNPGDVWRYPNSVSCLLVYGDGRYVHSSNTGEADGADQSASKESNEWTFTRMPDLRFVVERL